MTKNKNIIWILLIIIGLIYFSSQSEKKEANLPVVDQGQDFEITITNNYQNPAIEGKPTKIPLRILNKGNTGAMYVGCGIYDSSLKFVDLTSDLGLGSSAGTIKTPIVSLAENCQLGETNVVTQRITIGSNGDTIVNFYPIAPLIVSGKKYVAYCEAFRSCWLPTTKSIDEIGFTDYSLAPIGIIKPCVDSDKDGYGDNCQSGGDCDDSNPAINPNAKESCDKLDNNCNGLIDDGLFCILCVDNDKDGHYLKSDVCPAGDDPDDSDATIPKDVVTTCTKTNNGIEICGNSVDEDCDGVVNECGNTTIPTKVTATQLAILSTELKESTYSTIVKAACKGPENCIPYEDLEGNMNYTVKCAKTSKTKDLLEQAVKEECEFKYTKIIIGAEIATCAVSILITPLIPVCVGGIAASTGAIAFGELALESGCEIAKSGKGDGLCIASPKQKEGFCFTWANDIAVSLGMDDNCQTNTILIIVGLAIIGAIVFSKV